MESEAVGRRPLRRERVQGKGKGKWREANRRRQLQTATQPGVMLNLPTPSLCLPLAPSRSLRHATVLCSDTCGSALTHVCDAEDAKDGERLARWNMFLGIRVNGTQVERKYFAPKKYNQKKYRGVTLINIKDAHIAPGMPRCGRLIALRSEAVFR